MWLFDIILLVSNLSVGFASYHEQYRVPHACNERWESYIFNDKEYIIQNFPVKWEDAKILCRGHHNGTLAIVDSVEISEFLAEALSETQFEIEGAWVGSRRSSAEDPVGYRWVDTGVPLRRTATDVFVTEEDDGKKEKEKHFPRWINRTHVPVPEEGADCVALDRVNHDRPVFLDLPCVLERAFICERDSPPMTPIAELQLVRCKTGLYHVYSGHLTWDQAAAYCVLKKMTLANVGTLRCLKKIGLTMLRTRPSIENAWLGARGEFGKWTWFDSGESIFVPSPFIDGHKMPASAWPPMRDRNAIKQNGCLQLDRHASHSPIFMEARCERKMPFICYQHNKLGVPISRKSSPPPSDDKYYYILVKQLLYWQHAYDNCIAMNGTLAKIENNDVLTQLLLVMGENKDEPVDHIWIAGRLNTTRDTQSETVSYLWYNPNSGRRIPDPLNNVAENGLFMPPWLDDVFSIDNPCLNLDRQNHLSGLIYGMSCDTPQYSVCMIEKTIGLPSQEAVTETPSEIESVDKT